MKRYPLSVISEIDGDEDGAVDLLFSGAGAAQSADCSMDVQIQRHASGEEWLCPSGWEGARPQRAWRVEAYQAGADLIVRLPADLVEWIDAYDRLLVTSPASAIEGTVAWVYDGHDARPARKETPKPFETAKPPKIPEPPVAPEGAGTSRPTEIPPSVKPPEQTEEGSQSPPPPQPAEVSGPTGRKGMVTGGLGLLAAVVCGVVVWFVLTQEPPPPQPPLPVPSTPHQADPVPPTPAAPNSPTPDAKLAKAQAAAQAGNCVEALDQITAAADQHGYGPALLVKGKAFDPLHAEHRCLVNAKRWDIVLALKYYGEACQANVGEASTMVGALAQWVDRELASAVPDSRVADAAPAVRGAKAKCGLQ